jgi:hypothetical protein
MELITAACLFLEELRQNLEDARLKSDEVDISNTALVQFIRARKEHEAESMTPSILPLTYLFVFQTRSTLE